MTWFRRRRARRYTPPPEPAPMAPLDGETSASYMRRTWLSTIVLRGDYERMQAGDDVDPSTVCAGLVEIANYAMTTRARILDEQSALTSIPDYPPEET